MAEVAKAAKGKPVVVVVVSGESLDLEEIANNEGVRAIIWSGYPGQSGGMAIANALFGKVCVVVRVVAVVVWY